MAGPLQRSQRILSLASTVTLAPREASQHSWSVDDNSEQQSDDDEPKAPYQLYDAVKQACITILAALEQSPPRGRAGMTFTGLDCFDRTVGGFMPGEVVAMSGPRASGKTRFACELAGAVALVGHEDEMGPRAGVLYVTTHARAADIANRMICGRAAVSPERVRSGQLASDERDRIIEAADMLSQQPLWIDDRPFDSIEELCSHVRAYARTTRPTRLHMKLLVVDDLAADRASIDAVRTLVTELEWSALVILRGEEQPAPERLGADAHIVLRRVHDQIQPVLSYARHNLACLIPMPWPAEPEGLTKETHDELPTEAADERRRFRFASALADHLRGAMSDFRFDVEGNWRAIVGSREGWPANARARITFDGDTPILELTGPVELASPDTLRPLQSCEGRLRWSAAFSCDAPFVRRIGTWFVDRLESIVAT